MKLAFTNRRWHFSSFDTLIETCLATGISGLELHDVRGSALERPGAPLDRTAARHTVRELYDRRLTLVCFDTSTDISQVSTLEEDIENIAYYLTLAHDFRVPYVRIHARGTEPGVSDSVCRHIERLLPLAEAAGVTLLFETAGYFADTGKLRDILNTFASDSLAALWDMYHTVFDGKESPETTIENLGAYVRHVHIRDARGGGEYCLMGEGALPLPDLMCALASINYSGFIALEWDPAWMPEVADAELILTQFSACMECFGDTSRAAECLYENRSRTGKYVWKKDELIDITFPAVLDRMVELFPDQLAFKFTTLNYTRTYAAFLADVDRAARALITLGVQPGHHVALWATNLPEWYITFWAVTKIGAVLVSVNTAYKIHEAEYLLRQSDAHTLVLMDGFRDSDYRGIISELCPELTTAGGGKLHARRLPFLRNVITVGFSMPGALTWEDAMTRADATPVEELRRRAAAVRPHDVCNMQYTSGTTGFPKGVMLTHYNVVNNGKCIGDRMDLSTADRMMIHVPMFHCFGMVLAMTAAITHGVSLFPLPYFHPRPALACINRERITVFHGVPTMFIAMLEYPDFDKTDFSSVRTGIMAGSPCPIAKMHDVVDKMKMHEVVIVYGQTEASPGCTMSAIDDPLEVRVGTVGSAMPEIECRIVDPETGRELPNGQPGEFVARGYNIMKGYYKMPRATAAAIDKDGWLHTGDLAIRNPDGNYRITGRLKDMIIRGGENIYPKEIEEFVYTHPKVKDVQVIGVPDEQYGEEIMACIILKEGETMTADEMKSYIREHMARHKVPKYIDFTDSFPMNVAGKILKYKMREDAVRKLGLEKAAKIVTA